MIAPEENKDQQSMRYPIGLQTFADAITKDYLYIDKTEYVYRLAHGSKVYFLSRPRRFGKSMFLSTLDAYFRGEKELFKGLKIEKLEKEWESYPVLHIDLSGENYSNEDAIELHLNNTLASWERIYGTQPSEKTLSSRFKGIIERAHEQTGKQVVILIDEYDKPLTEALNNDALNEKFRNELRAFYGVLKSADVHIRFAMLTGVSKFSKISIFSDLNQLKDISLSPQYQAICGFTDEELDTYCKEPIQEMADANGKSYDTVREELRKMYDGYHFCRNGIGIYNPFSILNALDDQVLESYWVQTGTPTFLVNLLKDSGLSIENLSGGRVDENLLGGKENFRDNPLPIMYQSGYLTIIGYDEEFHEYELGFPNEEVYVGFMKDLAPNYLQNKDGKSIFEVHKFVKDLRAGDVEMFMKRLQTLYANLDFTIAGDKEMYFHNTLNIIFMMVGLYCEVEKHTSNGSMDVTIKTNDFIYIMELKYDKSPEDALKQIEDKNYAAPFAMDKRKIIKLGIEFDSNTRGIKEWKVDS